MTLQNHDLMNILQALAKIETRLEYMPTTPELYKAIEISFEKHKEAYCYRVHPRIRTSDGNGNGKDLSKIARFIGALIGAAILAASGGYFLGR
jgi:hypothetical protein